MKSYLRGSRLAVLLACMLATSQAVAQIESGRTYRGGEIISDPGSGLKLTIPAGWSGRLSPDGESFALQSDAGGGRIAVLAERMTEADARRRMAERLDLGGGIVLTPTDSVQELVTGHFTASYAVSGAPSSFAGRIDVRIMNSGLGVAFILLSPPDEVGSNEATLREFAFSLGVDDRVRAAPASAAAGGGDEWEPYLKGRYLARYFTGTGYTESTELWLCTNGTFRYKSEGGGFGGGASGAMASGGGGRWSATGAGERGTLVLHWSDGDQTTHELSYDRQLDQLYVNGERMLRGKNEYCS